MFDMNQDFKSSRPVNKSGWISMKLRIAFVWYKNGIGLISLNLKISWSKINYTVESWLSEIIGAGGYSDNQISK